MARSQSLGTGVGRSEEVLKASVTSVLTVAVASGGALAASG